MADTFTTNLNLTKPEPGAAEDTWGISLNSDLDTLDAIFSSSGTQVNLNPNQVNFADNKKAVFGAGSDLQIFHDGTNNFISSETGALVIRAQADDNDVVINSDNGSGGTVNYFRADGSAGSAILYNYGNQKLATTSTGINVTGTATMDGLTVDGTGSIDFNDVGENISSPSAGILAIESRGPVLVYGDSNNNGTPTSAIFTVYRDSTYAGGTSKATLNVKDNGDISFYDDTGTSQALFWDASAERLGIGTTSPSTPLELNTASFEAMKIRRGTSGTSASVITFAQGDGTSVGHVGGVSSGGLQFRTGSGSGTERARIDSSGNVGIGTTSPDGKLDVNLSTGSLVVNNSANFVLATLEATATSSNGSATYKTVANTTNSGMFVTYLSTDNVSQFGSSRASSTQLINTGGSSLRVGTLEATPLILGTNNAERARIDSSGRLLINRTSATGSLSLESQAPSGFSVGSGFYSASTQSTIEFKDTNTTANYKVRIGSETDDLVMFAGGSKRMTIDSSGNVGIGTISPSAALSISKQTTALSGTGNTYGLYLYPTSSGAVYVDALTGSTGNTDLTLRSYNNGTYNKLISSSSGGTVTTFQTGGSERMRIDSSGNVGIGTTSPDTLLNIASASAPTIRIENTDTSLDDGQVIGAVEFYKADSSGAGAGVVGGMQLLSTNSTGAETSLTFGTSKTADGNNVERLRIDASGNVGIGTTSPSRPLHIAKSSGSTILELQRTDTNTTGATGVIQFNASDDHAIAAISVFGDGDNEGGEITFRTTSAASDNNYFNSTTERMRIDSSGKVGIGTASIGKTLTVGGTGLRVQSTASADFYSTGQDALVVNNGTGNLRFWNNAAEKMRIDSSGNVGIGTSSPSTYGVPNAQNLVIGQGGASTGITLSAFNTASSSISFSDQSNPTSARGYMKYDHNGDYLAFAANGSEKARIDSSGNLLVGKTATGSNTEGVELVPLGAIYANRSGNVSAVFGRKTSDGSIVQFRKDGTTVGNIGVANTNNLFIGGTATDHAGIQFGTNILIPETAGTQTDGLVDLGQSGGRFKDLHLSGQANVGSVLATGNVTAYSDERLKDNIQTLQGSKVLEMRGVSFTKDGEASSGVIAQEIEKVAPELVHTAKDEMGTKSVAYGNLVGYLIEAIKDQQQQIDELKARLDNDSSK